MPLRIISREAWGAQTPALVTPLKHPVNFVFCMSTHTEQCFTDTACRWAVRKLQEHQMVGKNFRDLRYSFLIGGSNRVYEGRGWFSEPMLPMLYNKANSRSILIGFIGSFKETTLRDLMLEARQGLVDYGISHHYISPNFKSYEILDKQHLTMDSERQDGSEDREDFAEEVT